MFQFFFSSHLSTTSVSMFYSGYNHGLWEHFSLLKTGFVSTVPLSIMFVIFIALHTRYFCPIFVTQNTQTSSFSTPHSRRYFMARTVVKIRDINDSKQLQKMLVIVFFCTSLDGDIHVVVPASHVSLFDEKLTLDHIYTVSNFKVQTNVLTFRPSSHKFLITFTGGTSAGDDNKNKIPSKPLVFIKFSDIITDNFNNDVLIDIIGMVESIGYCDRWIWN
ncbi:unnamed protein product [Vicia faba]|uniref:DUF223 domain-containing protein n=1 Tax=Vicia faba TaxID=3906 RepID=A0AAV1AJ98_VICFA|nr:unnamed protein product [Vicia faba]